MDAKKVFHFIAGVVYGLLSELRLTDITATRLNERHIRRILSLIESGHLTRKLY